MGKERNISLLPIKCLVRSTEFVIVPPSNSMIMSPSCRLAREAGEELSNHMWMASDTLHRQRVIITSNSNCPELLKNYNFVFNYY